MSLQYLADLESTNSAESDDVLVTHWMQNGLILAGTVSGRLRAWHATDGRPLGHTTDGPHNIGAYHISSSSENERVLTAAYDGTVALWDASEVPQHLAALPPLDIEAEERMVTEEETDTEVDRWPLRLLGARTLGAGDKDNPGDGPKLLKNSKAHLCALLHPTEDYFVTSGPDASVSMYAFKIEDGEAEFHLVRTWRCSDDTFITPSPSQADKKGPDCGLTLAFSELGNILAMGTQKGRVYLFDVYHLYSLNQLTKRIELAVPVRALHFLPSGELLVGTDDGMISVYDVRAAAVTPESAADEELDAWEDDFSASQHSRYTMSQPSQSSSAGLFNSPRPSQQIQVVKPNAAPFVRSWETGSPWIASLQASPDGRIVAASSIDGHVRLWDFRGPLPSTPLCTILQDEEVASLCWKPLPADYDPSSKPSNGMMTAATQSAQTASAFVTGSSDGRVRWYRCAGSNVE